MKEKHSKKSKILSDKEVDYLSKAMKEIIGDTISKKANELGVNFEDTIRFHSLSQRIQGKRESLGQTIKDISTRLKIPQYKLKAIESSQLSQLNFQILEEYVKYLGLENWFKKWLKANPKYKSRL